jgi:arsenite-transporting ATPase
MNFMGRSHGCCFPIGLTSTLQLLFGNEKADQRAKAIDTAVEKLEAFRAKMARLRNRLQDPSTTSFVVVTIPTKLGVQESKRLMTELKSQGVGVTDIVLNQCIGDFEGKCLVLGLAGDAAGT